MHIDIFKAIYFILFIHWKKNKAYIFFFLFFWAGKPYTPTLKSTHKQKFTSPTGNIDFMRLHRANEVRTHEAPSDSNGSYLHYSYVPPL